MFGVPIPSLRKVKVTEVKGEKKKNKAKFYSTGLKPGHQ